MKRSVSVKAGRSFARTLLSRPEVFELHLTKEGVVARVEVADEVAYVDFLEWLDRSGHTWSGTAIAGSPNQRVRALLEQRGVYTTSTCSRGVERTLQELL